MEQSPDNEHDLTAYAADIVSAYVGHNSVQVGDLPSLIANVHAALHNIAFGASKADEAPQVLFV